MSAFTLSFEFSATYFEHVNAMYIVLVILHYSIILNMIDLYNLKTT